MKVSFTREGKDFFADVEVIDSNFNSYYTNLALHFMEERIQKRRGCVKGTKMIFGCLALNGYC